MEAECRLDGGLTEAGCRLDAGWTEAGSTKFGWNLDRFRQAELRLNRGWMDGCGGWLDR